MEGANLVCNPALAEKLCELGVLQESYFYWAKVDGNYQFTTFKPRRGEFYSAFTCGELGELMPHNYFTTTKEKVGYKQPWTIAYGRRNHAECADSEANCRALMIIFLIENGVIDIP